MDYVLEEKVGDVLVARVVVDEDPESPREWDNLGTLVGWHRRYGFTDKEVAKQFPNPSDFNEWWADNGKGGVLIPVFLFDHSGLRMSTSPAQFRACDSAAWDWGQLGGLIYADRERILKEYGGKNLTKKKVEQATKVLVCEIEAMDRYVAGEVFGWTVTDTRTGEILDSVWGYNDEPEFVLSEAVDHAKYLIEHGHGKDDSTTLALANSAATEGGK